MVPWRHWTARAGLLLWTNSIEFCGLLVTWLELDDLGRGVSLMSHVLQLADRLISEASTGTSHLHSMWSLILPQAHPSLFRWQRHPRGQRPKLQSSLRPRLRSHVTSLPQPSVNEKIEPSLEATRNFWSFIIYLNLAPEVLG